MIINGFVIKGESFTQLRNVLTLTGNENTCRGGKSFKTLCLPCQTGSVLKQRNLLQVVNGGWRTGKQTESQKSCLFFEAWQNFPQVYPFSQSYLFSLMMILCLTDKYSLSNKSCNYFRCSAYVRI